MDRGSLQIRRSENNATVFFVLAIYNILLDSSYRGPWIITGDVNTWVELQQWKVDVLFTFFEPGGFSTCREGR
jgi:hypothetical protein